MKRIILCTFIMLFGIASTSQLSAQEKYTTQFEVQYRLSYSPDTLYLAEKDSTILYLFTSKDYGVFMDSFKAKEKERREETRKRVLKRFGPKAAKNITFETSFGSGGVLDKMFYKDLQSRSIKVESGVAGKAFVFLKNNSFSPWKIQDEKKVIDDYTARKATTSFAGRDYVAWFTTEIPLPDGPYVFSGLPGLIVELYDTHDDYHFRLKSIYKLDKPNIWEIPTVAKKVTKKKFEKLKKKAKKNERSLADLVNSQIEESLSGSGIDPSKKARRVATYEVNGEKMSKAEYRNFLRKLDKNKEVQTFNNPIELH